MTINDNNIADEPDEVFVCPNCSTEHDDGDDHARDVLVGWGGRDIEHGCTDCASRCDHCANPELIDEMITANRHDDICRRCYDDYYFTCSSCDGVFNSDDAQYNQIGRDRYGDIEYDYDYPQCEDCVVELDEADEGDNRNQYIFSYSYRPSPVFRDIEPSGAVEFPWGHRAHGRLYMGYELETNQHNCSSVFEAAKFLVSNAPTDYLYLKDDGSISGFEIVSHPSTLAAHLKVAPFEAFEALATEHKMSSWRGSGCGLHVHLSKDAFTASHMMRFAMFHERNAQWLKRFAGRESSYARFGETRESKSELATGKAVNGSRYVALNFQNKPTVELRYFRGSLKPVTIKGVLEFCQAMYDYTQNLTTRDVIDNALEWNEFRSFVISSTKYEHTKEVFSLRGLV